MKFVKRKFLLNFILLCQTLMNLFKSQHFSSTSTEDLRVQLFITNQAIKNLKSQIETIKNSQTINPKFKQVNGKFESIEPNQIKPHQKFNEIISSEMQKEMKLDQEVHDFYNHNPKNDTLFHLKSQLKENGIREFEEMIDMLDNHPEELSHGTEKDFLKKKETTINFNPENDLNIKKPIDNLENKLNFKQSEKHKNKLTTHISKKANGPINIKDLLKHFN
jgi:hypothetical protein